MVNMFPELKIDVLALLSFLIILFLFTTQDIPAYAQVLEASGITPAMGRNTMLNFEQSNEYISTIFTKLLLAPSLTNHLSELSNNNHQYFQPPPIANTGHNQTVTAGSPVILNGSMSRSPGGIILGYSWRQIPTSSINLGIVNSSVWEFTAPKVNTNTLLQFQLNVTDNLGQVGTAYVNVIDKPAPTTIHASPLTQITKPSTKAMATTAVHSITNNSNRGQNVTIPPIHSTTIKVPVKHPYKVPISPPLIPPINQAVTR